MPPKIILLIFCWPLIDAIGLGESCKDNYYCGNIPNAECRNKVCQCILSTTPFGSSCLEDVVPKMSCSITSFCSSQPNLNATICVDGFCRCPSNFHFRNGRCENYRGYQAFCRENGECYLGETSVGTMVCSGNHCECNRGYKFEKGRCRNASAKNFPMKIFILVIIGLTLMY